MKSRPVRFWHRLFFRLSTPYRYSVEQAIKAALHRGIGIGMRQQLRTLISLFCDQCGEPAAFPDARFCAMCGAGIQHTERIPLASVPTGPITDPRQHSTTAPQSKSVQVVPGTLLRAVNTTPGGIHTKVMHAVGKAQQAELTARYKVKVKQ